MGSLDRIKIITSDNYLWPDKDLKKYYLKIFDLYTLGLKKGLCDELYFHICDVIYKVFTSSDYNYYDSINNSIAFQIKKIFDENRNDFVKSINIVSSILAMLMHFECKNSKRVIIENPRRPNKVYTTNPNSPLLNKLVVEILFTKYLKRKHFINQISNEKTLKNFLVNFKILDPSFEASQLLTSALIEFKEIIKNINTNNKVEKINEKLITKYFLINSLYGTDLSPKALYASRIIFKIIGHQWGISEFEPTNLINKDALNEHINGNDSTNDNKIRFDVIINNPPWGENKYVKNSYNLLSNFQYIIHRKDTYIAFLELAINKLKLGGYLIAIVPSSFLAAKNASSIREKISRNISLDYIIILPHQAFWNATIRGLLIAGKKIDQNISNNKKVKVLSYPLIKGNFNGRLFETSIIQKNFQSAKLNSWWPIIQSNNIPDPINCTELGEISIIKTGIQLYGIGKGIPKQDSSIKKLKPFSFKSKTIGTVPFIQGRNVVPFKIRNPENYIKYGNWLAYTGRYHEIVDTKRIFLRRLYNRNGMLIAGVCEKPFYPSTDIITIIPFRINIRLLTLILNSSFVQDFVIRKFNSINKVDFQQLTPSDVRKIPIPNIVLHNGDRHLSLKRKNELIEVKRRLLRIETKIRKSLNESIRDYSIEINKLIRWLYEYS